MKLEDYKTDIDDKALFEKIRKHSEELDEELEKIYQKHLKEP